MKERVKITLDDGKERTLRFTQRGQRELKERFGIDTLNMTGFDKVDMGNFADILCIGLQKDDPAITVDFVLDNTDAADNNDLLFSLIAALSKRTVKELEAAAEEKKAQANQPEDPPQLVN